MSRYSRVISILTRDFPRFLLGQHECTSVLGREELSKFISRGFLIDFIPATQFQYASTPWISLLLKFRDYPIVPQMLLACEQSPVFIVNFLLVRFGIHSKLSQRRTTPITYLLHFGSSNYYGVLEKTQNDSIHRVSLTSTPGDSMSETFVVSHFIELFTCGISSGSRDSS